MNRSQSVTGCQQLTLSYGNLSVDHAEKVQLTAVSEGKMFYRVRECSRVRGIFNCRHEHEQGGGFGSGLVTRATDQLRQRFDPSRACVVIVRFGCFLEVKRVANRLAYIDAED